MARGNDSETALHELADEFGQGVGNAEQLIDANAARRTQELAAISDLPVLEDETDEIDLDGLEGPNGERAVDAVVRGSGNTKGTIVVYEDEGGRLGKYLASSTYDEKADVGPRRSSRARKKDADGEGKETVKASSGTGESSGS